MLGSNSEIHTIKPIFQWLFAMLADWRKFSLDGWFWFSWSHMGLQNTAFILDFSEHSKLITSGAFDRNFVTVQSH